MKKAGGERLFPSLNYLLTYANKCQVSQWYKFLRILDENSRFRTSLQELIMSFIAHRNQLLAVRHDNRSAGWSGGDHSVLCVVSNLTVTTWSGRGLNEDDMSCDFDSQIRILYWVTWSWLCGTTRMLPPDVLFSVLVRGCCSSSSDRSTTSITDFCSWNNSFQHVLLLLFESIY